MLGIKHIPSNLILFAVAVGTPGALAAERPNVVFILTDDQGYGDLACHGNDKIDTPVLDRLATESVRFDRFFVCPLCTPTRASLLSGRGQVDAVDPFSVVTVDSPDAAPGFSYLGVRGNLQWRSGNGTIMLVGGLPASISGSGGGRFYGIMAMGRQRTLEGVRNPLSLYSFNVERVTQNPQFVIRDSKHIRIFYFKVEAGTIQRANAGDANTPAAIINCEDIHVCCMYGNVEGLEQRPMLQIDNSTDIAVSQLKAFRPSTFPHVTETYGGERNSIPSTKICALFVRDSQGVSHDK